MTTTERITTNGTVTKRLGKWTDADTFDVRGQDAGIVLDLRAPEVPQDVRITVNLRHSTLKLLVGDGDVLDDGDITWPAKGRLKDTQGPDGKGGRRIHLYGTAADSEIRVHRGGVAVVSAMLSREYLNDARQALKEHRHTTVDDPSRA
ncbi:hypothetical protein ACFY5K_03785 [Streptomyces griseofuscus]|uniref:hypothetical protein n=1 Tax=Streptomyces TaxID=1883 RepID=UPI00081E24EB|nr:MULTISPECIES: hypothetical protein [unclassified Streptomyces]MBJ6999532.1 hypothetical protein [Streptomyces sp. CRPSP2-6A1]MYQ91941.1 hypothetical protein [Streptomyces sp. SID4946]MYR89852.1 hypothetical protein [Streptomyces sp. SID685]SCF71040.1 hypothetical protein GA0115256_113427 [Streptomyces sp. DconLS]SCG03180.1 hypothetical protein GA0115258_126740 [Streptomyces sp. LamerLS-31b]